MLSRMLESQALKIGSGSDIKNLSECVTLAGANIEVVLYESFNCDSDFRISICILVCAHDYFIFCFQNLLHWIARKRMGEEKRK